jgi:hypothetical protein
MKNHCLDIFITNEKKKKKLEIGFQADECLLGTLFLLHISKKKSKIYVWIFLDSPLQFLEIFCNLRKKKTLDSTFMIIPNMDLNNADTDMNLHQPLEIWVYFFEKIKRKNGNLFLPFLIFCNLFDNKTIRAIPKKFSKKIRKYILYFLVLDCFLEKEEQEEQESSFLEPNLIKVIRRKKKAFFLQEEIFFLMVLLNFFWEEKSESFQENIDVLKKTLLNRLVST